MNFQFEFEFEYNAQERKRIDRLNSPGAIGPATFAVVWIVCFLPTIVCLLWMQWWSVVVTGAIFVLMASVVPAIMKFRGAAAQEFARKIELGALLPKRVIDESQFQSLRDQIAAWRNEPEASTEPTEMYRELFPDNGEQTWKFDICRDDLVTAVSSTSIRAINDKTFSFKNVEFKKDKPRRFGFVIFGSLLMIGLLMTLGSLPPHRLDLFPLVMFLCFNPIALLYVAVLWVRRRSIKSVPRLAPDELSLRLYEGGWAIGNEDLVAFNKWNERSVFYSAKELVGIRSDLSLIHILPIRGFNGPDGVWQFLDRAIRLKKNCLHRNSSEGTDTQTEIAVDNEDEQNQTVNPYQSPSVR